VWIVHWRLGDAAGPVGRDGSAPTSSPGALSNYGIGGAIRTLIDWLAVASSPPDSDHR